MTKPGKDRTFARRCGLLAGLLLACAGCATGRASIEKGVRADKDAARLHEGVAESYRVACPDAIEVRVHGRPELSGTHNLGASGRIDLGDYGKPRVEGRTLEEIARLVARETGSDPESVQVRVVDYRSQFVVLFGEVIG